MQCSPVLFGTYTKPTMPKLLLSVLSLVLLLAPLHRGNAQTIACFGDSLTAGYQAPEGQSYPDDLRKDLARMGFHATVLNFGQSGNTTKDGLSRMNTVLAAKPSIVILELGANDGFAGTPISIIAANLSTMIETFQRRHIRVLLVDMMMTPNLGPDYLKQFDGLYPQLAAKYHVKLTPFMLRNVFGHAQLMSSDGIHPDAAGYAQVAKQNILPSLLPMLHKK
jgi:acyl-CoA thioesterase-1